MKNKSVKLIIGISLNAIAIVLVIFLVYSVGTNAFAFGGKVFNEKSVDIESLNREVEVTIPDKITTSQLTKILYTKGLIDDKKVFYVQVELSDYKNKFIEGTYTLGTSMKPSQMMETLSTAATVSAEK
ncbi:endolytic transglycosylase MltG [[Clostridium] fimetarium]|uniref:UPF0755 protein n=1 Tax=[Clostridium] fimetarium TaxID=99656 RepID=A0A1I0N092_9FIRM|nr:endolytic transglycosylase MltG [[Clostridium] fimetarium]SEV94221.1 UPF0755 protein [[Clostridium] fimetarium]